MACGYLITLSNPEAAAVTLSERQAGHLIKVYYDRKPWISPRLENNSI